MNNTTPNYIFDESKAAEAAAYVLSLNENHLPYLKLIKLLYIADRTSIATYHYSITTDSYVSMKLGPVTCRIYDCIKNHAAFSDESPWNSLIRTDDANKEVILKKAPSYKFLSEEEKDTIRAVNEQYKNYEKYEISELTHSFPEWQDPGNSSIPISINDIIAATIDDAAGRDEAESDILISAHLHNISYRNRG